MKNLLFLIACVVFGNLAAAQTMASLKSEAAKFQKAHYNMFFEGIAEQSYPKLVEEMGGEAKFAAISDSDFQNNEVGKRWQIVDPQYLIGQMIKEGNKKFALITFRNPVRYFYENKMASIEIDRDVNELKSKTGAKDVYYEPKRNTINVKQNTRFLAISDASTSGKWKFINLDEPAQLDFADRTFGKDLRIKIGF